jgi:predicted aldo/keto reductase-like oxidoreductase
MSQYLNATCGYATLMAMSPKSFPMYFAPAAQWTSQHLPQVLNATAMEVRNGYPCPSYVHINEAVSLPYNYNLCNESSHLPSAAFMYNKYSNADQANNPKSSGLDNFLFS